MINTTFRPTQKPRLGELMLQLGFLTREQLDGTLAHLARHRGNGQTLGQAAVAAGICSEPQVMAALSRQLGLPFVDVDAQDVDCVALVPREFALKHRVVAVERANVRTGEVMVAIAAPARLDTQDAVRAVLGTSKVRFALAGDAALDRALIRLYGPGESRARPTPPAASKSAAVTIPSAPVEVMSGLDLSPRTVGALRLAASEMNITPREVIRRVMESWASNRRAQ